MPGVTVYSDQWIIRQEVVFNTHILKFIFKVLTNTSESQWNCLIIFGAIILFEFKQVTKLKNEPVKVWKLN